MSDYVNTDAIGRVGLAADPDALLTVGPSSTIVTDADILGLSPWAWWDAADCDGDFVGETYSDGTEISRWYDRVKAGPDRDWINTYDSKPMRYFTYPPSNMTEKKPGATPGSSSASYLSCYSAPPSSTTPSRWYNKLANATGQSDEFPNWTVAIVTSQEVAGGSYDATLTANFNDDPSYHFPGGAIYTTTGGTGTGRMMVILNSKAYPKVSPYYNQYSDPGGGNHGVGSQFHIQILMHTYGDRYLQYTIDGVAYQLDANSVPANPKPLWFEALGAVFDELTSTVTPSDPFLAEIIVIPKVVNAAELAMLQAYLNTKYGKTNPPSYDLLSVSSTPESADYVQVSGVGLVGLSAAPTAQLTLAQRATPLDFITVEENVEAGADYVHVDHEGLVGLSTTPDGTTLLQMRQRSSPQDFLTLKDAT